MIHLNSFAHIKWNLWLQLRLVSNHLSLGTSFPKYLTFASQSTKSGTSCKQTPLVRDCDFFQGLTFEIFICIYSSVSDHLTVNRTKIG